MPPNQPMRFALERWNQEREATTRQDVRRFAAIGKRAQQKARAVAAAALIAATMGDVVAQEAPTVQITVPMEIPAPATDAEARALQAAGVDYVRVYQVACVGGRVLHEASGTQCTGAWDRASPLFSAQEPFLAREPITMQVPVPLGTSYWAAVYHYFAYTEGAPPTSTEMESPLDKIVATRVTVRIESPRLRIVPTECKPNQPCVREVPSTQ